MVARTHPVMGNNGQYDPLHETASSAPPRSLDTTRLPLPFLAFAATYLLDIPLTLLGLAHGGVELNPLMRLVLAHGGGAAAIAGKLTALALLLPVVVYVGAWRPHVAGAWLLTLALSFAVLDAFSLFQLLRVPS